MYNRAPDADPDRIGYFLEERKNLDSDGEEEEEGEEGEGGDEEGVEANGSGNSDGNSSSSSKRRAKSYVIADTSAMIACLIAILNKCIQVR